MSSYQCSFYDRPWLIYVTSKQEAEIVHPGLYRLTCSDQRSRLFRCGDWRRSLGGAVGWSLQKLPSSISHVTARAGQDSSKDATLPLSPPVGAEVLLISRRSCWEAATWESCSFWKAFHFAGALVPTWARMPKTVRPQACWWTQWIKGRCWFSRQVDGGFI